MLKVDHLKQIFRLCMLLTVTQHLEEVKITSELISNIFTPNGNKHNSGIYSIQFELQHHLEVLGYCKFSSIISVFI